jgi:hypothetical protein
MPVQTFQHIYHPLTIKKLHNADVRTYILAYFATVSDNESFYKIYASTNTSLFYQHNVQEKSFALEMLVQTP